MVNLQSVEDIETAQTQLMFTIQTKTISSRLLALFPNHSLGEISNRLSGLRQILSTSLLQEDREYQVVPAKNTQLIYWSESGSELLFRLAQFVLILKLSSLDLKKEVIPEMQQGYIIERVCLTEAEICSEERRYLLWHWLIDEQREFAELMQSVWNVHPSQATHSEIDCAYCKIFFILLEANQLKNWQYSLAETVEQRPQYKAQSRLLEQSQLLLHQVKDQLEQTEIQLEKSQEQLSVAEADRSRLLENPLAPLVHWCMTWQ